MMVIMMENGAVISKDRLCASLCQLHLSQAHNEKWWSQAVPHILSPKLNLFQTPREEDERRRRKGGTQSPTKRGGKESGTSAKENTQRGKGLRKVPLTQGLKSKGPWQWTDKVFVMDLRWNELILCGCLGHLTIYSPILSVAWKGLPETACYDRLVIYRCHFSFE